MQPTYQQYTDDGRQISELSLPVFAVVPLGRNLRVSLLTSLATAGGDQLTALSGLNDAQLSLSYTRRISLGSLVFNLGVNAPTGKQTLSAGEFETMRRLSQDFYRFRVPSLGQGLNVSPGLTWAFPLNDDLMLGLGAAYQFRGSYTPRSGVESSYDPGNEFLLTGGADLRLSPNTALSGDLTYTLYGDDEREGEPTYEVGNKLTATVQLLSTFGFNELRLVGRYRSRGKSTIPTVQEAQQTTPNAGLLLGSYRMQITERFYLQTQLAGRYYGETRAFPDPKTLAELTLAPELQLGSSVRLSGRAGYTVGSFSGLEAGLGMDLQF